MPIASLMTDPTIHGGILMTVHRSLSLRKFITALNDRNGTLLQRYFQRMFAEEQIPPQLSVMDYDNIGIFLRVFIIFNNNLNL